MNAEAWITGINQVNISKSPFKLKKKWLGYACREIIILWSYSMNFCYNCMNEILEGKKCSKCGFVNTEYVPSHRLKPGTMLSGRYFIGSALGEGKTVLLIKK